MATDYAVRSSFMANDRVTPAFKQMGASARGFGASASSAFGKASRSSSMFSSVFGGMLAAFSVQSMVHGLVEFGKEGAKLASDLGEVQNVVDVTFGQNSNVNSWAKNTIKQFGLSELQAKEFSSTLGSIMKPAGLSGDQLEKMSMDLTALSGDFMSFRNLSAEDAFNKIRAGIVGETEPLKSLGIVMTQANLQAFALSKGMRKNVKDMSQAEQTMLRYNFIMNASKDAQGDFARTLSTSAANQQKLFTAQKAMFAAGLMEAVVPLQVILFTKLNKALEWAISNKELIKGKIEALIPYLRIAWKMFKTLAGVVSTFSWAIPPLVAGIVAYNIAQKAMLAMGTVMWVIKLIGVYRRLIAAKGILIATTKILNLTMLANPVFWIPVAVAAAVVAIVLLVKYWDKVIAGLKVAWDWFSKMLDNPFFTGIMMVLAPFITIPALIIKHWSKVKDFFVGLWEWVGQKWEMLKVLVGFSSGEGKKGETSAARSAPNEAAASRQNVNVGGDIFVHGPEGTKVQNTGSPDINFALAGANP